MGSQREITRELGQIKIQSRNPASLQLVDDKLEAPLSYLQGFTGPAVSIYRSLIDPSGWSSLSDSSVVAHKTCPELSSFLKHIQPTKAILP